MPSRRCGKSLCRRCTEKTGITYARGEVLLEDGRLLTVDRDVEGAVVRREIVFLVGIPAKQPILGSFVIVIIVADEHFIFSHVPSPFVDVVPRKISGDRRACEALSGSFK